MVLSILTEDSRTQLISRSKTADREKIDGKTRYEKRVKSKIKNSTREMNNISMNDLFKNNLLTVDIPVRGETDDYHVRLKFSGVLDLIQKRVEQNNDTLQLKHIIQALTECFNSKDVYIHCDCPDWKYRMAYYATVNQITSGAPETRPSNITNPHDTLGPGCKHIMLVISNQMWITVLARVIYNYYIYMKTHSQKMFGDYIYPAIHGHEFEEPEQTTMFDTDDLDNTDVIDMANKERATSTQFKQGNKQGIRFAPNKNKDQIEMELDGYER